MKRFLYKLKWRILRPQAFGQFARLMANERKSVAELEAEQEAARQRIVRTALEVSPFYRAHYAKAGFKAEEIGTEGWFERLPIVTKQDLREHFEEFVNPQARQFLKVSTTGGSTGTPTKTGYDGRIPEETYSWRLQSRFGVKPWDDHAYVWRDRRPSRLARFKNALMWWPTKHLKLDASFMTEESIAAFLKKFDKLKPTMLQGYVGAVSQVAQYVLDHPNLSNLSNLKFVWTTSAPLSKVQRGLIEKAFGAPVCDEYGSCECRWIACQCEKGEGLHVNVEHVHIEFVDENNRPVPKGEYGRTLITNLEDTVFPLIRYENNDRGRWLTEPCSCGRALPCIDSVKGREVESFVLPSGKTINGEYLTTIFDATPDLVRGFKVTQHRDLSITIEFIVGNLDSITLSQIKAKFENDIGHEVPVEFKAVNEIKHDRGKIRYVVREK